MLRNTDNGYGWPSIILHWIGAIGVIGLFALGLYMVDLDYYDPLYHQSTHWHESLGILFLLLMAVRFIWRQFNPKPKPIAPNRMQAAIAHWAHRMLYLLMLLIPVSGYLIATADGHAVALFDWLEIPSVTGNQDGLEDTAGEVHYWLAVVAIALTVAHLGAAIKHHFIDKDDTLKRMFGPR